jgi:hypothetical protein
MVTLFVLSTPFLTFVWTETRDDPGAKAEVVSVRYGTEP